MASEALTLREVDAYYGDSHVLRRVSLRLGEGRLLGLLGRNGAERSCSTRAMDNRRRPGSSRKRPDFASGIRSDTVGEVARLDKSGISRALRAGSVCLDRFSGLIGGVSAGFRPPRSAAAE